VASREAQARESTQTLVLQQLEQQRQSASGVNLDEEIVALTQYQRAYEAASHLVRVADEMLDTLINRTI
jgi:flagellar hook-associated protein 1 FlgK